MTDFGRQKVRHDGLHPWCKRCVSDYNRAYATANRARNADRKRARRAAFSEEQRAAELARMRAWHQANREAALADMRARRLDIKLTVMRHYGPACTCCGEFDVRLLTIEHANGDGADHRRELSGTRIGLGAAFYRWLIKNGFPDDLGLIVLCGSCNQSSHHNGGTCPHADPDPTYATSLEADVIQARIAWLERQLERLHQSTDAPAAGAKTVQS